MTNKPEHTALPLPIERKHGEYFTRVFFCANGYPLLYLNDRPDAEGFEELITRACNSHYGIIDVLDDILNYDGGAENALHDEYLMERAAQELAKAKGE